MFPLIPSGSWLLLAPIEQQAVRAGDVVVFPGLRGPVCHRVIEVDWTTSPATLRVRGDSQVHVERVPVTAVAYRVEAVHRHGLRYRLDGPFGALARAAALRAAPALRLVGTLARQVLRRQRG